MSDLASHIKHSLTTRTPTDAPAAATFDTQRSKHGVDISHGQNSDNTRLAKQDHERLAQQRELDLKSEKAVLASKLSSAGRDAESDCEKQAEGGVTLVSSVWALGQSVCRGWEKVSANVHDATHPLPLDVHEKVSDNNGVDTTSIQNANNNAIGERIKQQNMTTGGKPQRRRVDQNRSSELSAAALAPTPSSPSNSAAAVVASRSSDLPEEDAETAAIKAGLDGGVAIQDAIRSSAHAATGLFDGLKHLGDKAAHQVNTATAAPTTV